MRPLETRLLVILSPKKKEHNYFKYNKIKQPGANESKEWDVTKYFKWSNKAKYR